jgi:predicted regulator of Ras-like GTPase activity (Roadblock/LC7/MglB family)
MSFTDSLQRVIHQHEEAQGVALVGLDGIVVEEQKRDKTLDLQSLGAEYCSVLKTAEKAMSSMDLGSWEELSVQTDKALVLIRRVHEQYFLLLVIRKDGNFGKGRYLLRREAASLKSEL